MDLFGTIEGVDGRGEIAMLAWWIIGTLIMAGVVIAKVIWAVAQAARNDTLPVTSTQARAVRVNGKIRGFFGLGQDGGRFRVNEHREYYVTFELLPDSKPKKFAIPIVEECVINEGNIGTLTFQGTRFISFE